MSQNRAVVLGLTGGSGAGKGEAAKVFAELGALVIDGDTLAHQLMASSQPCFDEVRTVFGDNILTDGEIDRKKLGSIVFSDKEKLAILSGIVHRYVRKATAMEIAANTLDYSAIVFDGAALFEAGMDDMCDYVVGIFADEDTRLRRILGRDGVSEQTARARIGSQMSQEDLLRRVDFVIYNNDGIDKFRDKVQAMYAKATAHK